MSTFSNLDLSLINSHRKRTVESQQLPDLLKFEDYRYPQNHSQNGKRLKLPPLLSYKLPTQLLSRLNVKQLDLEDVDLKLSVHPGKRRLHRRSDSSDSSPTIASSNSNSNPNTSSVVNTSKLLRTTKKANTSIPGTPQTPKLPETIGSDDDNMVLPDAAIKIITDQADSLKKSSIGQYKSKDYNISILNFTQSYILFVLALRLKEYQNKNFIDTSSPEYGKFISRKRRDWINVLLFGEKIIDNFTRIVTERLERPGNNQNDKRITGINHILGYIYYMNGFVLLHISEILLKYITFLKGKTDDESILQLSKSVDKYQDVLSKSNLSLQLGERKLGIFVIARQFPNLWSLSFTKQASIKKDEIVLSNGLRFSNRFSKLKTGVNYCLPISSHMWDLDTLINFGGFFLKEWRENQEINEKLIFIDSD